MQYISIGGYHGTGSGLCIAYFKELQDAHVLNGETFAFQSIFGLEFLETQIFENTHRINLSYSVYLFEKMMNKYANSMSKNIGVSKKQYLKVIKEFITEISHYDYQAYVYPLLKHNWLSVLGFRIIRKLKWKFKKPEDYPREIVYFKKDRRYFIDITKDEFYKATNNLFRKLVNPNDNSKRFVIMDQLASTSNPLKFLNYIHDSKIIIVDRDPRDLFIENVLIANDNTYPKNVEEFCDVYRKEREKQFEHKDLLYIRFEDLIYKEEDTLKKIIKFIDYGNIPNIEKKYFKPHISIKNTKLYERYSEFKQYVKVIEERLSEFLYETSQ